VNKYIPCDYQSRVKVLHNGEILVTPVLPPVPFYSRNLVYDGGYSVRIMAATGPNHENYLSCDRYVKKIFQSYNGGIPDYTLIAQPVIFLRGQSSTAGVQFISCDTVKRSPDDYFSITSELCDALHILLGKPLLICQVQFRKYALFTNILEGGKL
jgi:hypothetical protein